MEPDTDSRDADATAMLATFAHRLKALRQRKGLQAQEMAERIGLSKNHYHLYERGEFGARGPNLVNVFLAAKTLGVSMDYLLGESDIEPTEGSVLVDVDAVETARTGKKLAERGKHQAAAACLAEHWEGEGYRYAVVIPVRTLMFADPNEPALKQLDQEMGPAIDAMRKSKEEGGG